MTCIQSHFSPEFPDFIPENNEVLGREITRLAGHINAANCRFLKLLAVFVEPTPLATVVEDGRAMSST